MANSINSTVNPVPKKIIRQFIEERVKNRQQFYVHPSYNSEQKMLQALSKGLFDEAAQALDAINRQERATLARSHVRSLKNSLICTCTLFTRAIINGGVHPENAYNLSDVFIRQIEETNGVEELKALEYEMLHSFFWTLRKEKKPAYNSIVNKTISYIHEEMFAELTLEQLAAKVNVHPYYLSGLFKQEVGLSISEYITRNRIEDSTYFLIHSDLRILDISVLLGFCNQSYYTRQFKKYMSMTPLQYRNRYSEQEEPHAF
ncbi:AraC family transcriptional regulator [Paenibacillus sp. PK3_47]|uniref:AraC family transcriptional regulator n=1 Tax=Paenibacillus sp. PK3_47 TaxID=2072642 RepID=UPI00201DEBEC|nr:AraC family transcriptional regulator [Paenibacillus sp. PK3_47]UQZ37446.1 AraC family transcriptional regulator [Paenibacillus sp. PK3_47]